LDTIEIDVGPFDHDLQSLGPVVHLQDCQPDEVFALLGEKSAEFEYAGVVWFENIQHKALYQNHSSSQRLTSLVSVWTISAGMAREPSGVNSPNDDR
jgi:hypothetical protein